MATKSRPSQDYKPGAGTVQLQTNPVTSQITIWCFNSTLPIALGLIEVVLSLINLVSTVPFLFIPSETVGDFS